MTRIKKQKNIDWLFFDVGGVLVDDSVLETWRRETILAVTRKFDPSIDLEQVNEALRRASSIIGNLTKNTIRLLMPSESLREKALAEKDKRKLRDEIHYYRDLPVRAQALKVVSALSHNYKLGIIANQPSEAKEKLTKAGLLDHFDHIGISEELGLRKPDPRLFQLILRQSGADPIRSIMIDDNCIRSLAPAKKLGMKTVWLNLTKDTSCEPTPDFEIQRLEDLLSIF